MQNRLSCLSPDAIVSSEHDPFRSSLVLPPTSAWSAVPLGRSGLLYAGHLGSPYSSYHYGWP